MTEIPNHYCTRYEYPSDPIGYHCNGLTYQTYLQVLRLENNCKNDIDHLTFPGSFLIRSGDFTR